MHESDIPPELLQIFRDELLDPALVLHASMTTDDVAGWTSASMIGIIMALEGHLGVEFDADELRTICQVGDLAELIRHHRA